MPKVSANDETGPKYVTWFVWTAIAVKNELVAQGVRSDHIRVKGSGADGNVCAVSTKADNDAAAAYGLECTSATCTGRGGHVFITVSKIDLEAAGIARGIAGSQRSFAEELQVMMMSPEQQAKVGISLTY